MEKRDRINQLSGLLIIILVLAGITLGYFFGLPYFLACIAAIIVLSIFSKKKTTEHVTKTIQKNSEKYPEYPYVADQIRKINEIKNLAFFHTMNHDQKEDWVTELDNDIEKLNDKLSLINSRIKEDDNSEEDNVDNSINDDLEQLSVEARIKEEVYYLYINDAPSENLEEYFEPIYDTDADMGLSTDNFGLYNNVSEKIKVMEEISYGKLYSDEREYVIDHPDNRPKEDNSPTLKNYYDVRFLRNYLNNIENMISKYNNIESGEMDSFYKQEIDNRLEQVDEWSTVLLRKFYGHEEEMEEIVE